MDANDNAAGLQLNTGAGDIFLRNCTLISTQAANASPASNDPPSIGLEVTAAMSDLRLEGCVFDGGTIGFADPYALKASAAAVTRLRGVNMSFLRGADYTLNSSTTGYINVQTSTGAVLGVW